MACKRTPSWKSNSLRSKTLEQEAIFFVPRVWQKNPSPAISSFRTYIRENK